MCVRPHQPTPQSRDARCAQAEPCMEERKHAPILKGYASSPEISGRGEGRGEICTALLDLCQEDPRHLPLTYKEGRGIDAGVSAFAALCAFFLKYVEDYRGRTKEMANVFQQSLLETRATVLGGSPWPSLRKPLSRCQPPWVAIRGPRLGRARPVRTLPCAALGEGAAAVVVSRSWLARECTCATPRKPWGGCAQWALAVIVTHR